MPSSSSPTSGSLTLGIDIGGTSVKCVMLRAGEVVHTGRSRAYDRPSAEGVAAAIREAAPAGQGGRIGVIGLCVPGLTDPARRVVTRSLNLPGLEGASLDALLTHALSLDAHAPGLLRLCTDAHAAAHDFWFSTGRRPGRLLALSLGTGVGAAVLDDDRPLVVSGQGPGHIGAIDVSGGDPAPPMARDGAIGTLEAYIGLPALVARLGPQPADALGRQEVDRPPLEALVRALRIAHAIYRPTRIALLGGVGRALAGHIGGIRAAVVSGLTTLAHPDWTLEAGTTDLHAALGAARLAQATRC